MIRDHDGNVLVEMEGESIGPSRIMTKDQMEIYTLLRPMEDV